MREARGFTRIGIDGFCRRAPRDPGIVHWFEGQAFLDSAYASFKGEISSSPQQGKKVVLETTGVGSRWKALSAELESRFVDRLLTAYLRTSPEASVSRIRTRNVTECPIKMAPEQL